ncbi:MAG TPA: histidine kinase dimerization/phosphoacceptor domain -containing protein, partial [Spirochaetota bacterium]|nr:histidine kinase dimerization/phosphoacceptor domain -containing protein [Spirochaetota bacterium]
ATNEELNAAFEELEAANEELIQSQHEIIMSEEKYRKLFTHSTDGVCIHELIYSGDAATDYRILDVNPMYESIIGLKKEDIVNRNASDVYGTGTPPYLDLYASVAETEVPVTFITYFEPMDRHFHISVFSPGKGFFVTVFKDNTDRTKVENDLRKAFEEKESLLRELQHRVKNNLAMISGLIGLEAIRAEEHSTVASLNSLRNRINALEKLYTSLYHTGDVREIQLDTYISEIAESVMNTYISGVQNIRLETELAPLKITIKHAASIGLIINELLVNALKYAFPDGREGVVIIRLIPSGNGYEIHVADNGEGLDKEFDINNSSGSGIMIIMMLVEHMGGRFLLNRGENTEFRIVMPGEE